MTVRDLRVAYLRLFGFGVIVALTCTVMACSVDCGWDGAVEAWIDLDGNGQREAGEEPLANVVVFVLVAGEDVRYENDYAVTDTQGLASFSVFLPGCPKVVLKFWARPPAGYEATTLERVDIDPGQKVVRFGFRYQPGGPAPTPTPFVPITCWTFLLEERPEWQPGGLVTSLAFDPEGAVWAGTGDSGSAQVYRLNPVNGSISKGDQGLSPDLVVNTQVSDLDGTEWSIQKSNLESAVVRRNPSTGIAVTYSHATTGGAMAGGLLTSLANAPDGSLWIGMEEHGALHFSPGEWNAQGGTWIHYDAGSGLPTNRILSVGVDPQGIVWFGSDRFRLIRCQVRP
jgi:hypothetical protein